MRGRRITRIDVTFGHVDFRLVGDVAHHSGLCTGAEQCSLRALEHLDTLDIGRVDVEISAR